jgi:phospholipid/cholesterol/gamma-HCH transport system substrate-binding protein
MRLHPRILIQLALFVAVAVVACGIIVFGYIRLPATLFGVGHYRVTVELPEAAGLYKNGNVTYRGTEVGRVENVSLTDDGARAVLSLRSDVAIPADSDAQVHSQSAVGEQYVALLPRSGTGPALKDGDIIPRSRVSVPPDINSLLDATNKGLQAIPADNLKTTIDESYAAVGGLGPDLSRLVRGSTQLAIDARTNLNALITLIDQSGPVLDSQADTADAIGQWAANLARLTTHLRSSDRPLGQLLQKGPAAETVRQLFERLQPTLPIVLANLVTVGHVAVTYQPGIEQLLVLIPQGVANLQGILMANLNTKQDYRGAFLDFNLNINLPPPCTTGFLPIQQQRTPSFEDSPDRPAGDLYCRVPQDSPFNVRAARNYPCETVPGKRAPTVKMCESNEPYVPLNDGFNWKGDPNATLSGQDIPQLPPGAPPAQAAPPPGPAPSSPDSPAPPVAFAPYDPATGTYLGPDGRTYTQSDLARDAPQRRTWQSLLIPPTGN